MEMYAKPIFSSSNQVGTPLQLSYIDVKSVINQNGKDRKVIEEVASKYKMANGGSAKAAYKNPNKQDRIDFNWKEVHEGFIFKYILSQATTWRKFINMLKEYLNLLIVHHYQWNVVWYDEYRPLAVAKGVV